MRQQREDESNQDKFHERRLYPRSVRVMVKAKARTSPSVVPVPSRGVSKRRRMVASFIEAQRKYGGCVGLGADFEVVKIPVVLDDF
jgi:hypothetical protein